MLVELEAILLRLVGPPGGDDVERERVLGKVGEGGDPSFPPFWLPFQDSDANNHEVLWTEDVACTKSTDCGSDSEFDCLGGVCTPKLG